MTDIQKMINDLVKKGFNLRQIAEAIGEIRQAWIKSVLYQCFSVDSLSDVDVNDFLEFIDKKGIKDTIPVSAMGSI